MNTRIFEQLRDEGLLSEASLERVKTAEGAKLFSVYWELKTLLYLGVLLLTSGLGILIYKNIDTIGHQVILTLIALICIASFFYCVRKKQPFSLHQVPSPNVYYDYVLLLGCLSLLIFLGYLQAQYSVFGDAYGLATFLPMVILFFCAYYFDHIGVLSIAITNLAAWVGIAVTPMKILKENDFADTQVIIAGLVLGVFLTAAAHFSDKRKWKKHFSFTYLNFGINIVFISCLAAMFHFDAYYAAWLIPLAALAIYFTRKAFQFASFYLMLMIVIYCYIGLSYVVVSLFKEYVFSLMYFISSGIAIVVLLIQLNQKLKHHARL